MADDDTPARWTFITADGLVPGSSDKLAWTTDKNEALKELRWCGGGNLYRIDEDNRLHHAQTVGDDATPPAPAAPAQS